MEGQETKHLIQSGKYCLEIRKMNVTEDDTHNKNKLSDEKRLPQNEEISQEKEQLKIEMILMERIKNFPPIQWQIQIPDDLIDKDTSSMFRKLRRWRLHELKLTTTVPTLTLLIQPPRELFFKNPISSLCLKKQQLQRDFSQVQTEQVDEEKKIQLAKEIKKLQKKMELRKKKTEEMDELLNYGIKYWSYRQKNLEFQFVFDPHNKEINLTVLQKEPLMMGSANISLSYVKTSCLLKGNHEEKKLLPTLFKSLTQSKIWVASWEQQTLINDDPLVYEIPIETFNPNSSTSSEEYVNLKRVEIFKHVFLTELLTQMIANRFGRRKTKHKVCHDGYEQQEYKDQELEELRSLGYRFSEFRDHPIDPKEQYQIEEENQKQLNKGKKKGKLQTLIKQRKGNLDDQKKTKIGKIGQKIRLFEQISNFTLISGRQKSEINKKRLCLHQMSKETDKTQGMINFVQLVFSTLPKEQLIQGIPSKKKEKIKHFMKQFRVRRRFKPCIEEYTRQSFFHRILNIGLRVLKSPHQLIYLRLVFSHVFWSIKLLYQRLKQNKNLSRIKKLYRGCSLTSQEVLFVGENIGGYLELEGFISTSLSSCVSAFQMNVLLVIQISVEYLKGMFDNGFADLSKISCSPNEEEVLINAFNVFKIKSIIPPKQKRQSYQINLEYGSMKVLQEKVKKSDNLLEAEYKYRVNCMELEKGKRLIEEKQAQMSKEGYKQMVNIKIPEAKQKLEKRKQFLEEWRKDQYEKALKKLAQWDKQLILNTQHQQQQVSHIQSYGELLWRLGEYKRAAKYFEKRIKQVESDKAVEGHQWRKNECLNREKKYRVFLLQCYGYLGQSEKSINNLKKLQELCQSINAKQAESLLRFTIYCSYFLMVGTGKKRQKVKEQLKEMVENEKDKFFLEQMMKIEKEKKELELGKKQGGNQISKEAQSKEGKQKEQQIRTKKVEEKKERLKNIEVFTSGKYSQDYFQELYDLIHMFHGWKDFSAVIREGENYLSIRKLSPHAEDRIKTCTILAYLFQSCFKLKEKHTFSQVCHTLASFIGLHIDNYLEFQIIFLCLCHCVLSQWWRAGKQVVIRVMDTTVTCKVLESHLEYIVLFGYAVLLMNVSEDSMVNKFVRWAQRVYQSEGYSQKVVISHMISYNDEYNRSEKSVLEKRKKDYLDKQILNHVTGRKRSFIDWEESRANLIPFQRPFHPHYINHRYIDNGFNFYSSGEQPILFFQYLQQQTNIHYHILTQEKVSPYLFKLDIISKLHLSKWQLSKIPALLSFYSPMIPELMLQRLMGIDLVPIIDETQHLSEDVKNKFKWAISYEYQIMGQQTMALESGNVGRMKKIYRRYRKPSYMSVMKHYWDIDIGHLRKNEIIRSNQARIFETRSQEAEKWKKSSSQMQNIMLMLMSRQLGANTEFYLLPTWYRLTTLLKLLVQKSAAYPGLWVDTEVLEAMEGQYNLPIKTLSRLHISAQRFSRINRVLDNLFNRI